MPLVKLEGVFKRYKDATILEDVELEIQAAEFVCVTGRSGSGKSTLLRIIGGLEPPDAGSVLFAGRDIAKFSEKELSLFRRESLGFVFQAFNLIETLTIAENVALPLSLNGHSRASTSHRVDELLDALEISAYAARYPDTLSGGEQQRAAIARALAHRPRLVIADEPTGNLDEQTAATVMGLLVNECRTRNASLIIATHSDEVRVRSNRTMQISEGRLEITS